MFDTYILLESAETPCCNYDMLEGGKNPDLFCFVFHSFSRVGVLNQICMAGPLSAIDLNEKRKVARTLRLVGEDIGTVCVLKRLHRKG